MTTTNLAPVTLDAFPVVGATRDTTLRTLTGWQLTNNYASFVFKVTSPAFQNGAQPNVTITFYYLEDTDGGMTVAYDSSTGVKTAATYSLAAATGGFTTKSVTVNDARFAGTNGDIIITVNNRPTCDPVLLYVSVQSATNPGRAASTNRPPSLASDLLRHYCRHWNRR